MSFRPLLSATVKRLDDLRYPLLASPKLDGIRCLVIPGDGNWHGVTRSLKKIPNRHIYQTISRLEYGWLDGELIYGDETSPGVYNNTNSAVMSHEGTPRVTFRVFDCLQSEEKPFRLRLEDAARKIGRWNLSQAADIPAVLVSHVRVENAQEAEEYEAACLEEGYEGIMLRDPLGIYKRGRSTLKQQILMKVKRFLDDEAVIIDFLPRYRNENEATINALGYQERSTAKAGQVQDEALGALVVEHPKWGQFQIGSGFTEEQRVSIWKSRSDYHKRTVTFKYQPVGIKDKPRFPIFLRFRSPE